MVEKLVFKVILTYVVLFCMFPSFLVFIFPPKNRGEEQMSGLPYLPAGAHVWCP
jgi:hypothetical protein